MACACATAWCTAAVRALSCTALGLANENVSESIWAAFPVALTTASIAAPSVEGWRSMAETVSVAW